MQIDAKRCKFNQSLIKPNFLVAERRPLLQIVVSRQDRTTMKLRKQKPSSWRLLLTPLDAHCLLDLAVRPALNHQAGFLFSAPWRPRVSTNVDDSFFSDPRYFNLLAMVGNPHLALGRVVSAWKLAQWNCRTKSSLIIATDLWECSGLAHVIEAGLAERVDGGIYVKGSKDRCSFILAKKEAGRRGGLVSAQVRAEKERKEMQGDALEANASRSKQKQAEGKQTQAEASTSNPISLSLSLPSPLVLKEEVIHNTPLTPQGGPCAVSIADSKPETSEKPEKTKKMICPPGVSDQVWSDFVAGRKNAKAPLTQTAMAGIVREATKAGWSLEAALSECVLRGWRSFKADWVSGQRTSGELPASNEPIDWTNGGRL